MNDPYKVIGVDKTASKEQIRKAYRRKAAKCHPDKSKEESSEFKELNDAYRLLSCEDRRKSYDETGNTEEKKNSALETLAGIFQSVILSIISDSCDVSRVDVVAMVRSNVTSQLSELKKLKAQNEKRLSKLQSIVERIKKKEKEGDNDNLLVRFLDQPIRELKKGITDMDKAQADLESCVEILSHYKYDYSDTASSVFTGVTSSYSSYYAVFKTNSSTTT